MGKCPPNVHIHENTPLCMFGLRELHSKPYQSNLRQIKYASVMGELNIIGRIFVAHIL